MNKYPSKRVILFALTPLIIMTLGIVLPAIFRTPTPAATATGQTPQVAATYVPTPEGEIIPVDGPWERCDTEEVLRVTIGDAMVNGAVLSGAVISPDDPIRQLFIQVDGVWYSTRHNGGMYPVVDGREIVTTWGSEEIPAGGKRCPSLGGIHIHMVDTVAGIVSYSIPTN